jgi:hypothetical protein
MPRKMKYSVLAGGFLAIAFSGALALAPNLGRLMAHGCLQMMQPTQAGASERPNDQWQHHR